MKSVLRTWLAFFVFLGGQIKSCFNRPSCEIHEQHYVESPDKQHLAVTFNLFCGGGAGSVGGNVSIFKKSEGASKRVTGEDRGNVFMCGKGLIRDAVWESNDVLIITSDDICIREPHRIKKQETNFDRIDIKYVFK